MASISRQTNGRRRIQFTGADGKRKTLRLGKVNQRTAEAVKVKVEDLVTSSITGHGPNDETARWLAGLDQAMLDKLSNVGLIGKQRVVTLGEFLDEYIGSRSDVKPRTQILYRQTKTALVEFFGADRPLRDITPGDGDAFRLFLLNSGLSENTARRRIGRSKQFLTAAVRRKLIPQNPFADLKSAAQANPSRFYFVTVEEAQRVLDACPNNEWRLLFALSRFGGLRCPSEHLLLRWGDVDWQRGRMLVHSPKTEHHPGGESRLVPIFPELRPYLEKAFDEAEPGTEFIITKYRSQNSNLRTQLERIIGRAGLKPWPKLFQNLRSTRETELAEQFPLHVVCQWIGNTAAVAAKHYLQVTDEHFARAGQGDAKSDAVDTESDVKATQIPTSYSAACSGAQKQKPLTESGVMRSKSDCCDSLRSQKVPRRGLEPPRGVIPH